MQSDQTLFQTTELNLQSKDNKYVGIFLNQKICKVQITRKDSSLSRLKQIIKDFPFIAILILFYLYNWTYPLSAQV